MKKLSVELQYCYGIKKLKFGLDFSQRKAYAVYAPNGSMKTSLAETFKNIAEGTQPRDRIFPKRPTVCKITDENGAILPKECVLVLPPYDEYLSPTEKTCTLLVNNALRKECEKLLADLEKSKETFLKAMKEQSGGSKKDLESEIAVTFTKTDDRNWPPSFYRALDRIKNELKDEKGAPFAEVAYDSIFDEKILAALQTKDFKKAIQDYIARYNELLAASNYFKKGIFEYYNASQIAKTLADNGFFNAKHTVTLNAKEKTEISTQKQLEDLISKELENITQDKELKSKFVEIKKAFEKNVTLRDFISYISSHESLLPHLANIDLFKEKIWKSYFKKNESLYTNILEEYHKVKSRREKIEEQARKEQTQWEAAIDLFNDRFFVPFALEAKNKIAVTLGAENILDLGYTFKDDGGAAQVEKEDLLKSLSQGEKKALYILNIIFEIEVRRHSNQETLFVIDDIADSFDYKNKYAIIQYLQEISEGPVFKQIILTHNFDFFRTVNSRFVDYEGCLMASKDSTKIELVPASGIRNIFVNDWKLNFFKDGKKRIASIPFLRNLIEFTREQNDADYIKLTSLLHWKSDSPSITQSELDTIYANLFGKLANSFPNSGTLVIDMIRQEAKDCLKAPAAVNFENKIVLSIAIRLAAEQFMAAKIADAPFLASITRNQTQKLLARFQEKHGGNVAAIKTLRNVALMTPENIHLNAFMYEPILDMSDEYLRKLYQEVSALK